MKSFRSSLKLLSTAAFLLTNSLAFSQAADPGVTRANNVVLVHGLYADGSSWADVIPILQKAGLHVTSVQNPLTSFPDDVDATKGALALQDGPTVLVAHSYGGMVISEAGTDPKVSALVFIAARAPDAGEDYAALVAKYPPAAASKGVRHSGGFAYLTEETFMNDFAGDLPRDKAQALYAVQGRVSDTIATAKTTAAAWRSKPSFYAVSTNDRTINPDLERFMADRMKAHTIELDASHVSLVSQSKEVADLILEAAGVKP
jgi:pimeloyl-ACP methyl ester carboxylesterase